MGDARGGAGERSGERRKPQCVRAQRQRLKALKLSHQARREASAEKFFSVG